MVGWEWDLRYDGTQRVPFLMRLHVPVEIAWFKLTDDAWEPGMVSFDVSVGRVYQIVGVLFSCSTGFRATGMNLLSSLRISAALA